MIFNTLCGFRLGLEFSFCPSVWMDEVLYGREWFSSWRPEEMAQSELLYKKIDNTFSRGKVFVSTYWNLSTLTDMVVLTWRYSSKNWERFWYMFFVCAPDSHTVTRVCFLTSWLMRSSNFRSTECSGHFTRNCSWQMMTYQPGNWITRFPSWYMTPRTTPSLFQDNLDLFICFDTGERRTKRITGQIAKWEVFIQGFPFKTHVF